MLSRIVGSSLMIFASWTGFAQSAPAPLAFEAASLKPTADPGSEGRVMRSMKGGPGTSDPGRFTYSNVTLKLLVEQAYNLKEYQVQGPDWIDGEGFDLVATMPPGTSKEQAAEMMQTLLAERFKLVFHRETKQMPVYALVVGKNGSKMKEVEVPAAAPDNGPNRPPSMRGPNGPGIRVMMTPEGIRLAGYLTMTQLTDQLTRQLARPVLDQTELTKTYDVDITWMPDEMKMGAMRGGGGPGGPGGEGTHASSEPASSLPQALDEKLGLKLETRKTAADIFIVDSAEKAPVAN